MRKMKFVAMALTAALALQFTVPAFAAQLPETEAAPEQAATAEAPDEVQAEALEEENLIEFRTLVRYASNTHPSETVSVGFTSNTNYSWSSSDTSVVTVDQKGRVSTGPWLCHRYRCAQGRPGKDQQILLYGQERKPGTELLPQLADH